MEWNMTHCTRSLLVKCHVSRVTLSKVNQTLRINKHNSITFRCNWLTELNPKLGSKLLPIYLFFKSLPQLQWKCRNVIETNSTTTIKVQKKWSYFNPNVLTLILWGISFCTISTLDSTLHLALVGYLKTSLEKKVFEYGAGVFVSLFTIPSCLNLFHVLQC